MTIANRKLQIANPRILARSIAVAMRMLWLVPWSMIRRGSKSKTAAPDTLLCYSQVPWDEVWQRPQEFATHTARRRPVVYFSPLQVHRLLGMTGWTRRRVMREAESDLTVVSPVILPGHYKSRAIHWLNNILLRAEVRLLVGDGRAATLLTNSPFAEMLCKGFRWRSVAYDVIDDYAAFDWAPPEAIKQHRRLVVSSEAIVTGTRALLDDVEVVRPDARFIPCGVRFERFHRDEPGPIPADIADIEGPIVGYVGSISERIDRAIIRAAAERHPDASFVFIGPVHGSFGEPPRAPNIRYLGLKPHEVLPDYMTRFDLALMPFRLTAATLAINPVKTLEYLAAGLVVLSTAIPDVVRFYDDVVVIAESPEEFVDLVGELLSADNAERQLQGVERARGASWAAMADEIADIIEGAEKRRDAGGKR